MQLHRAGKSADWEAVPAQERSVWQRMAAHSHGFLTPANAITLVGLALVLYGGFQVTQQQYWLGLGCMIAGRLADLLDGWIAEHTQTKHAVGEFLDGAADKIATVVMLGFFLSARIAPWWILGLMFLPHLIIGVFSLASWARHIRLHPSRIGKYTMAAVWVVLIGYVLLFALQLARTPFTVLLGSLALVVAGAGFYVASSYTRRQD